MNIDIETNNTFERRNKVCTTQWKKIYKVIELIFLKKPDTFPYNFIKKCKDNAKEAINIPIKVNNDIKIMGMEHGLYAHVIKLHRKDLKLIAASKNTNEAKFKFQDQSARSLRWFNFEFIWIEVHFSTREPDFYKSVFRAITIHMIQIHLKYFKFQ